MRDTVAPVVAAFLLSACGSAETRQSAPVARVNGEPIAIESRAPVSSSMPSTASTNVERAITRHLAAEEATRRGLAKDAPAGTRSVKDEERLRDALFASMRDSLELGEDELRAHYERTKLRYASRQVVLSRTPFASEADARAEDRRLGVDGRLPASGAETIGPSPADRLPQSVMPEALSLTAPGQRVAVARDGRWWLVELEEIRAAEPIAFELVRPQVEQSLRLIRAQAEFRAEIERLRREAEIEIDESALADSGSNEPE